MGANRPPSEGVECRLGSSIIKTASPKKTLKHYMPVGNNQEHEHWQKKEGHPPFFCYDRATVVE
jgi:hypothetical protein